MAKRTGLVGGTLMSLIDRNPPRSWPINQLTMDCCYRISQLNFTSTVTLDTRSVTT